MTRIVLISPGSTDFDDQGRITGTLSIPLNSTGMSQAQQMAGELQLESISVVYSGPCQAASDTAKIVADKLKTKWKVLPKLYNLDHGLWQGLLVDDLREKQKKVFRQWQEQPETVCPPEGEMVSEAMERAFEWLDWLMRKHKEQTIALVVPEPLTTLVRCCVEQTELGELWLNPWSGGRWEVIQGDRQKLAAALAD